jgi:hypothetical protein
MPTVGMPAITVAELQLASHMLQLILLYVCGTMLNVWFRWLFVWPGERLVAPVVALQSPCRGSAVYHAVWVMELVIRMTAI